MVGSSAARGVEDVEAPPAIPAAMAAIGQPWFACQIRFGAARTSAIAPATHGRGSANRRRGPKIKTPTRQHAITGAAMILISMATPVRTPNQIHGAPAPPIVGKGPDQHPQRRCGDDHVEGGRLEQVADGQHDPGQGHRPGRSDLVPATAADLPGDQDHRAARRRRPRAPAGPGRPTGGHRRASTSRPPDTARASGCPGPPTRGAARSPRSSTRRGGTRTVRRRPAGPRSLLRRRSAPRPEQDCSTGRIDAADRPGIPSAIVVID